MNQREFLVDLSVNLGNLWNPCDMQRSMIVKHLQIAVDQRALQNYKASEEAMNVATELIKAMIQSKKEAGF